MKNYLTIGILCGKIKTWLRQQPGGSRAEETTMEIKNYGTFEAATVEGAVALLVQGFLDEGILLEGAVFEVVDDLGNGHIVDGRPLVDAARPLRADWVSDWPQRY